MDTPLISICVAAYNVEKFIEATLRTIESQTFQSWELIFVDDGSSDRTESFVTEFAKRVPQRVIFEKHPRNRGVPAAKNTAISRATGEWIAFLDADDLWKPQHLETLVSTSHIDDADAIFAGSIRYDDATWTKLRTQAPSDKDLVELPLALYTGRFSIMSSAIMIKRSSLLRYGHLSPEFPHCNDTEYWLRILSQGGRLLYTGANTCIYREHNGALSRHSAATLAESAVICERYAKWNAIPRSVARQRTANLYRWAGRSLLSQSRKLALSLLGNSLRIQPLNPKTIALWTKAFFCTGERSRLRAA